MGDFVHGRESVLIGRIDSDVTDDLPLDAAPTTVRRKSNVRFATELTISINNTGDPPLINSSCGQPNHQCVLVDTKQMISDRETSNERGAQFHRWRTDRKEREARMEQNIKWLKEEITKLKQQDQSLMRQFLQLRSVIYQLKGTAKSKGPMTKLPRIAASSDSIVRSHSDAEALDRLAEDDDEEPFDDDDLNDLDDHLALTEDPYLPEFRNRTVSLLDPSKVSRGRGGSGGYGYLKSRTMSFSVGASARELDRAIIE